MIALDAIAPGNVLPEARLKAYNDDDRPLVIDQPEENLDPKSVYDELVPLFQAAKRRRQVIMVTHNANLVINTDADQIIVAEVRTATGGGLPPIGYESGGLDEKRSASWCAISSRAASSLSGTVRGFGSFWPADRAAEPRPRAIQYSAVESVHIMAPWAIAGPQLAEHCKRPRPEPRSRAACGDAPTLGSHLTLCR